jgi:rhomboid protease GluP
MNGVLYILLGVVVVSIAQLLWRGRNWFGGYIAQLGIVAVVLALACCFPRQRALTAVALTLFAVTVIAPAALAAHANRLLLTGQTRRAAQHWKWISHLVWGKLSARYGDYSELFSEVYTAPMKTLEQRFDQLLSQQQPAAVVRTLLSFKFLVYSMRGEWQRAVTFFEGVGKWSGEGSIGPRLQVARAYAELGNLPEAIGQLHHVLAEPQSFRYRKEIFLAQAPILALAGDLQGLRALFRQHRSILRRLPRQYAPYWMGRCRMMRGEREEAALDFHEALRLTPPHHTRWREAVQSRLQKLEATATLPGEPFAASDAYARAMAQLKQTHESTREIRSLLALTQPALATGLIVAALIAAHLLVRFVFLPQSEMGPADFFDRYGNVPTQVSGSGEWWRLASALFLHAGWMHLLFNSATILAFGSPIERLWGRARTVAIFFAAALAGNALSVLLSRHEQTPSVGASGGAFGLLAAYWLALVSVSLPKHRKFKRRLVRLLSAVIALEISLGFLTQWDRLAELLGARIDNGAHLGGFAAGLALSFFLRPPAVRQPTAPQGTPAQASG